MLADTNRAPKLYRRLSLRRATAAVTAAQWWDAVNGTVRLSPAQAMALRRVDVFDQSAVRRASIEVVGLLGSDGSHARLSGVLRDHSETVTPPRGAEEFRDPLSPTAARTAIDLARNWTFWEARYAGAVDLFGADAAPWLGERLAEIPARSRLLFPAAGEGRHALAAARAGHDVTAFDLSPTAVGRLREAAQAEDLRVDAVVADTERWLASPAADGRWDAIVLHCFGTGDPDANERVLRGLAARSDQLIAELAQAIFSPELIARTWRDVGMTFAQAKVPVVRIVPGAGAAGPQK
ncbi:class I SAM-dependent methyltransferase [Microbacterium gorillae]|uniref:class I SAM-dependent methyltransferase n=1 Tax=Microbacterium gorillae TaxID=1231063 RepID=UPI000694DF83|nr:class I SAM-dependent methyltransferase [Microbacterium gorillae]